VAFAAERPGIVAGKARLPEPPRKLSGADAAIVRGNADSIALKLACHDPLVQSKACAGRQQARACVRGSRAGPCRGDWRPPHVWRCQKIFRAMLDDRFHRGKFDQVTDRADAPIEEAVALNGARATDRQAPPAAARKIVDLWRPLIRGSRRKRSLIVSSGSSKTKRVSGMPFTICSTALDMARTAVPSPTRRQARRENRTSQGRIRGRRGGADAEDTQTRIDEADVAGRGRIRFHG